MSVNMVVHIPNIREFSKKKILKFRWILMSSYELVNFVNEYFRRREGGGREEAREAKPRSHPCCSHKFWENLEIIEKLLFSGTSGSTTTFKQSPIEFSPKITWVWSSMINIHWIYEIVDFQLNVIFSKISPKTHIRRCLPIPKPLPIDSTEKITQIN